MNETMYLFALSAPEMLEQLVAQVHAATRDPLPPPALALLPGIALT